jgi:predicted trehalose synthase
MIAFFTLERAVHELSYELANRPAWVEIPLKGILAILAKARSSENTPSDEGIFE